MFFYFAMDENAVKQQKIKKKEKENEKHYPDIM